MTSRKIAQGDSPNGCVALIMDDSPAEVQRILAKVQPLLNRVGPSAIKPGGRRRLFWLTDSAMSLLVMDAQADLCPSVGFLGSRIDHRRGAVLAAVDAYPDAAIAPSPGGDVHIISNAIQPESLPPRPNWVRVNHFRLGDRERLRHRMNRLWAGNDEWGGQFEGRTRSVVENH